MNTYIKTILTGFAIFPFVAALITLPYVMYQYHKHSAVSKYRTLVIYSFVLYMLVAYFMVILPLPSLESTVGNQWQDHINLIPCNQIIRYWKDRPLGIIELTDYLSSFALWQLLFNILLTVPFGIYLRYYFKQSFGRTVLYSFCLSLFYETTQLSALYGIYPGPYRLADVEDLICNTLGGALGYQIAYVFANLLPDRDTIDEQCRLVGQQVTGKRRFWASVFDYVCCDIIFVFIGGIVGMLLPEALREQYLEYRWMFFWTYFCAICLLQVLLTHGATLGHAICRMILVSEEKESATSQQLIRRYLYLWLFVQVPQLVYVLSTVVYIPYRDSLIMVILRALILLSARLYLIMYFINEFCRRGAVLMPHDKLSRTLYMAIPLPSKRDVDPH